MYPAASRSSWVERSNNSSEPLRMMFGFGTVGRGILWLEIPPFTTAKFFGRFLYLVGAFVAAVLLSLNSNSSSCIVKFTSEIVTLSKVIDPGCNDCCICIDDDVDEELFCGDVVSLSAV